jgi:signal transduction histidine kinase
MSFTPVSTQSPAPFDLLPYLASTGRDAGAGLAFMDREARFLFVSDGMAAINGLPPSEHIGRRMGDLWPDVWVGMSDHFGHVLAGEPIDFEVFAPTAEPALPGLTFHAYWSPVRVGEQVVGVAATVVDVTKARESAAREHRLAARQSALRGIANAALSDASIQEVFDLAIPLLQHHLNVPFARAMRISPGSDRLVVFSEIGWDTDIAAQHELGPRSGSFADFVLSHQGAVQFDDLDHEERFRRPPVFLAHGVRSGIAARVSFGGQQWGQLAAYDRCTRQFDCDEVAFIEELAAILGLMVHERDSRAFREEVLSMASHQMRTPLTSVIGLAQHIKRRVAQGRPESAAELVDSMVQEAFRLDEVLSQWNELAAAESYREAFASDPVDVAMVVAECVGQFRSRQSSTVVREQYPHDLMIIESDARRIGEIIENLLENARKYGGDAVEVSIERRSGGVAVHCRDHGPGVPPEIAPYIFDRFFRGVASAEHSGMGLGLYISRKLAEGLGGTLDVASTAGEGAHFTLFLPEQRRPRSVTPSPER